MSGLLDLGQSSWPALCAVACGLGARHALDADHISVIDGIARRNVAGRPGVARLGGVLFSTGHCIIVAMAAVAAVILASEWHTPAWLQISGTLITVAILLTLAVLNLRAAWRPPTDGFLAPMGWKSRVRGDRAGDHPLIVGVGGLFALSFDTVAQAAAIGFAATAFGGMGSALAATACFAIGMILVGGGNGGLDRGSASVKWAAGAHGRAADYCSDRVREPCCRFARIVWDARTRGEPLDGAERLTRHRSRDRYSLHCLPYRQPAIPRPGVTAAAAPQRGTWQLNECPQLGSRESHANV